MEREDSLLPAADFFIIPADVPLEPGMTCDDLFNINASIVRKLVIACAKHRPQAHLLIISNPVNSTVPKAYETLRAMGVSSPNVFGVTTLDIIRARTFIGEIRNFNLSDVAIKVVGGHSGLTVVPLLGSTNPSVSLSDQEAQTLIQRIQFELTQRLPNPDLLLKPKQLRSSLTISLLS